MTIIIGTVALRKATLQGHLVNMAHSTPRKSMVVMRHDIDGESQQGIYPYRFLGNNNNALCLHDSHGEWGGGDFVFLMEI